MNDYSCFRDYDFGMMTLVPETIILE